MTDVPHEVQDASLRLRTVERPPPVLNRPQVFVEIIENDRRRAELLNMRGEMALMEWHELGRLTRAKKLDLRPQAEAALSWNTNKGKR
jgi:hypothetical protein